MKNKEIKERINVQAKRKKERKKEILREKEKMTRIINGMKGKRREERNKQEVRMKLRK